MTTSPTPQDRAARIPPALAFCCILAIAVVFGVLFATSAATPQEWRHHGGDPGETYFSRLDQIDAANVAGLELPGAGRFPRPARGSKLRL